jgi:hypothetical protein
MQKPGRFGDRIGSNSENPVRHGAFLGLNEHASQDR